MRMAEDEIRDETQVGDSATDTGAVDGVADQGDGASTNDEGADTSLSDTADDEVKEDNDDAADAEPVEVETGNYRITGLVDQFDEQNNITGQFPIGSVQELPVEYGASMVEAGSAELVEEE